MPTLSVITLTRNRLDKVLRLIERLVPQLAPGDEWLLIDTGSDDGTRERLRTLAIPVIRLLIFEGEGSWAEMRNFGVAQARGSCIAFLDDDCLPAEDWVLRGKAALAEADAVGGIVQPLGIPFFPPWWHPEMAWMAGLSVPGQAGPDAGRIHYPSTSNLWARASVCRAVAFQEVGGELGGEERARYRTGREDAQWWRRLRVEGYRTRFDPLLTAGHAIDPARLDLDYLHRRAGLDGQAWAMREGTRQDLAPLAYQWWRQFFSSFGALWGEEGARTCDWHYHRLTLHRHGEAIKGLEAKYFSGPWSAPLRLLKPWYLGGLGRLTFHQAKTGARLVLQPMLKSRPLRPAAVEPERLAIVAFGFLGDLIILQSALRGLMHAYPHLELYVLAPPAAAAVLADVKRLNVTITPELKPASRKAREWVAGWLERLDPDVIVAPYLHEPWGRTLLALSNPPRPIIGFDADQGLKRLRHLERLGCRVHKNMAVHESLNLCALFGAAGFACEPQPAQIQPRKESLARAGENPWLARHLADARPLIMLNLDAGYPHKEWTDEGWAELLGRILAETDWRVVINADRTRPAVEEVVRAKDGRVHLLPRGPLADFVGWLSLCDALVTIDSGPQQLAQALDVPTVTLYGLTDERRWGDFWRRPIHRTLRACAADLTAEEKRGLPINHEVSLIRPEAVFLTLKEMLMERVVSHEVV